jgi:hypothetical protein
MLTPSVSCVCPGTRLSPGSPPVFLNRHSTWTATDRVMKLVG